MSSMSEKLSDARVRLIGQTAAASILWAGTFIASKSDTFSHPGTLPLRLILVLMGKI